MTTAQRLTVLMRLSGGAAMLLGLFLWGGLLYPWLPIHLLFGVGLVLAMWATALLALRRRIRRGLAVLVCLWGLGIVVFGRMQAQLLPGGMHWVIRLAHLLAGVAGVALGMRLAVALRVRPVITARGPSESPRAAA